MKTVDGQVCVTDCRDARTPDGESLGEYEVWCYTGD